MLFVWCSVFYYVRVVLLVSNSHVCMNWNECHLFCFIASKTECVSARSHFLVFICKPCICTMCSACMIIVILYNDINMCDSSVSMHLPISTSHQHTFLLIKINGIKQIEAHRRDTGRQRECSSRKNRRGENTWWKTMCITNLNFPGNFIEMWTIQDINSMGKEDVSHVCARPATFACMHHGIRW